MRWDAQRVSGVTVRIAIRGTGSIGMQHAAAVRAAGTETILVPVREERMEELERSGFRTAPSLAAAKAAGAVAAIIATDTVRHARDALEAMHLGMDVLVEKPLGPNLTAIAGLCQEARRLGRQGFVGCVLRFDPGLARFRTLLSRMGTVHHVRVACQSYLPDWRPHRDYRQCYSARAEEGGVIRDLIHEIDYACWCLGWPKSVMARLSNYGRLGIEAEESADLWWEVGASTVTVHLDYLTKPPQRWIVATGSQGTLVWDFITQQLEWQPVEGQAIVESFVSSKETRLLAEDEAFIRAVSGGLGGPLPDLVEGATEVAICDAARESSHRGQWVKVEFVLEATRPTSRIHGAVR